MSFPPSERYGITALSHSWGPTSGGTMVVITGHNLPPKTVVTFGGSFARFVSRTPKSVTVITPPHPAGTVDVIVSGSSGKYDVLVGVYTYRDVQTGTDTGAGPPTGGGSSGGSGTTTGGGSSGGTGGTGGDGSSSSPPGGGTGGGGTTTPPGNGSQTGGATPAPDASVDLPNGLRGRRIGPGHPYSGLLGLFGSSVCQADTCEGLRFG